MSTASSSKVALLCLLGVAFLGSGSLAQHPASRYEAQQDAAAFLGLWQTRDNNVLGNAYAYVDSQPTGYTGFRGTFQWMAGVDNVNDGIFNFLQFFTDEVGGYIGLQNYANSSKYIVIFSLWDAIGATAGEAFDCSTFGGEGVGYKCFNLDFDLKSNSIYYLDVEIKGSTVRGYISNPQHDLSNLSNSSAPRQLIGEINYSVELSNLIPYGYYNENYKDQDSCELAYELVTVNCAPEQYNEIERVRNSLAEAQIYNSICQVENILVALTADKQCTIYFTRPTIKY